MLLCRISTQTSDLAWRAYSSNCRVGRDHWTCAAFASCHLLYHHHCHPFTCVIPCTSTKSRCLWSLYTYIHISNMHHPARPVHCIPTQPTCSCMWNPIKTCRTETERHAYSKTRRSEAAYLEACRIWTCNCNHNHTVIAAVTCPIEAEIDIAPPRPKSETTPHWGDLTSIECHQLDDSFPWNQPAALLDTGFAWRWDPGDWGDAIALHLCAPSFEGVCWNYWMWTMLHMT
jgi:hypothetical protein